MPERKSRDNEEDEPTIALRRSPRFLHALRNDVKDPETQKLATRDVRFPDSFSTLRSSTNESPKKSCGISQWRNRKVTEAKTLPESREAPRRSARLNKASKNEKDLDLEQEYVIEKRVTRSSVRGSKLMNNQDNGCHGTLQLGYREVATSVKSGNGSSSRTAGLDFGANLSANEKSLNRQKQHVKEKRRVTRSSVRGTNSVNYQVDECISDEDSGKKVKVFSKEEKGKCRASLPKPSTGKADKRFTRSSSQKRTIPLVEEAGNASAGTVRGGGMKRRDTGDEKRERNTQMVNKRKRNQVEEVCGIDRGWSKEQELALRNAYFTAKPTPHFWKKVAKMVPGKSAEECFDRIHSDHLTPQPRTRSRANNKRSSPLSFSAGELLSPAETKTVRRRSSRRKTLLAQRTVRQLLENQLNEDRHYEADLFSVLEPTVDPTSLNFQEGTEFASPAPEQQTRFLARSSSAHKKHRSRLTGEYRNALVSPPVLKQIKNKALHEKYIDVLHCRDAKRKAESSKNAKRSRDKHDNKERHSKVNSVEAVRDSLVIHAQDAVNQFRSLQSNIIDDIEDGSDASGNDEDDSRDEL